MPRLNETPAEIAARYGATVSPEIQIVKCPPMRYSLPNEILDHQTPKVWGNNSLPRRARDERAVASAAKGRAAALQAIAQRSNIDALKARVAELHADGLSDRQMSARLGRASGTVQKARVALGLDPHVKRRQIDMIADQLKPLHAAGKSDREIAADLKATTDQVVRWRSELGLAVNRMQRKERGAINAANAQIWADRRKAEASARIDREGPAIMALRADGLSYEAVAARLGLKLDTCKKTAQAYAKRGKGL